MATGLPRNVPLYTCPPPPAATGLASRCMSSIGIKYDISPMFTNVSLKPCTEVSDPISLISNAVCVPPASGMLRPVMGFEVLKADCLSNLSIYFFLRHRQLHTQSTREANRAGIAINTIVMALDKTPPLVRAWEVGKAVGSGVLVGPLDGVLVEELSEGGGTKTVVGLGAGDDGVGVGVGVGVSNSVGRCVGAAEGSGVGGSIGDNVAWGIVIGVGSEVGC
mmetsp:Transcript_40347/g.92621  ORF Transcript_40347/g.92621 Transcript_40347/m.92621 type:complete len:221 (+) Transcript_40347:1673-2335(+)